MAMNKLMDSIQLISETAGKFGQKCSVSVTNGNTYNGIFRGYCESTKENPLTLRMNINESEAKKIGIAWLREIGISYEKITNIKF